MLELPPWEPHVELILSIIVVCSVSFLLFLIATSQLHCMIRAILCTNAISVLAVAVGQLLIAVWCIEGSRLIGHSQFHFFAPIMVHQSGYYMCACTFLLITIERLMLCYKPNFYELTKISFTMAFLSALMIELCMTFPVIMMMQYESWSLFCASFIGLQEFLSFSLLIVCYRKSSIYYNTKFATVNLNSRYQVRCVIELTRAFIPLISSALSVKAFVLVLTVISMYSKEENAADAHFLVRVACLSYCLIMPFLLIFQVKTLQRRFASFFPSTRIPSKNIYSQETQDSEKTTRKYFEELQKQWK